jgi:flagellar assembly protein FliH
MNKEYLTRPGLSGVPQVLRDVTPPSMLHTLTRPLRSVIEGAHIPAMGEIGAIDEHGYEERLAGAERAAFEKGVAQGRQEVLEKEFMLQREDGYAAGIQAGMEEGRRSGEQLVVQAANERLRKLETLLQALPAQLDELLERAEDDMVALSMEALYRILGKEAVQPDAIRAMLKVAIGDRRAGRKLVVHLHPLDYQVLKNDAEFCAWLEGQDKQAEWTLAPDTEVRLGGVLLNTSEGMLDARLETQLQLLNTALVQQRTRHLQHQRIDSLDTQQKMGGA